LRWPFTITLLFAPGRFLAAGQGYVSGMTTSSSESEDHSDGSYTDMTIHDEELPEDLQPTEDPDPSGTRRPGEDAEQADDQLGQVAEGTQTASHGDAAATDTPS
jgi:hypothetical protein